MSKIAIKTGDEEWLGDLELSSQAYGTLNRATEQLKLLLRDLDTVNEEYVITIEVIKL